MKFGDEFVLEFGDKFGESPNLGTNMSPNLGTNLVNPQIWGQICPQICPQKAREHMGQFLQGGKNCCFVSLFLFTESLRVAKPYKIKLIFQLILVDWVLCIVKTS